jgi:hypothetical protein
MYDKEKMLLFYAVCAVCFAFAVFTMLTRPDRVEMVGGGINQREVIGQNTRLEVALAIGLHPNASTRKVCRADIDHLAITSECLTLATLESTSL